MGPGYDTRSPFPPCRYHNYLLNCELACEWGPGTYHYSSTGASVAGTLSGCPWNRSLKRVFSDRMEMRSLVACDKDDAGDSYLRNVPENCDYSCYSCCCCLYYYYWCPVMQNWPLFVACSEWGSAWAMVCWTAAVERLLLRLVPVSGTSDHWAEQQTQYFHSLILLVSVERPRHRFRSSESSHPMEEWCDWVTDPPATDPMVLPPLLQPWPDVAPLFCPLSDRVSSVAREGYVLGLCSRWVWRPSGSCLSVAGGVAWPKGRVHRNVPPRQRIRWSQPWTC